MKRKLLSTVSSQNSHINWGGNILSDMNGKSGRTLETRSLRFYTVFINTYSIYFFNPL